MEGLLLIGLIALIALGVLLLVSYPVNGHGTGYYPYFGPDGDRGPEPWHHRDRTPGVHRENH